MSNRLVDSPANHGWSDAGGGKWTWNVSGSGGAGAGMVISETEPTDKVEGMQWLNPTTGLVLFWDGEKWLEMPGGVDGADGKGWTSGAYDPDTGVITFASDDELGFVTEDLRGADGADSNEWVMCTQAEYDALTPDANTVYFIT